MINKVEEIRIPCECVGGSILEAIPNNTSCFHFATDGKERKHTRITNNHRKVILFFSPPSFCDVTVR